MARRKQLKLPALPETMVRSAVQLSEAVDRLATAETIGLDTEFIGEESYRPELCLIQLSTTQELFLIDPFECGKLDRLWEILLDPRRTVVVHAGREEIRIVHFATNQTPINFFDLQIAAGLIGYTYPISYANLVQETMHVSMSKSETLTDWRRRPLTVPQVRYAFDDVRYLLPIQAAIQKKLVQWDRESWAAEEFAGLVAHSTGDASNPERWRRIKGLGTLTPRELAVARELYQWREGYASRTNRPVRYLMRDDLLIEVARRKPLNVLDLGDFRGLPRPEFHAILDAVQRGSRVPTELLPEQIQKDVDPPHLSALTQLLGLALQELCRGIRLAHNIAATQADLKQLVRLHQNDLEPTEACALQEGWRSVAVRPYLQQVLDGELVLRVTKPKSRHPIAFEAIMPDANIAVPVFLAEEDPQEPATAADGPNNPES